MEQSQTSQTPAPAPASAPADSFVRVHNVLVTRSAHEVTVRFDCETNVPGFRRHKHAGVTRSLRELALYAAVLALTGPSVIVPVLPLPTAHGRMVVEPGTVSDTELPGTAEMISQWFDRVYAEKQLRLHPETRRFIEADFSYEPERPPAAAPAGAQKRFSLAMAQVTALDPVWSGAALAFRGGPATLLGRKASRTPAGLAPVHLATGSIATAADLDEPLALARSEITRLEKQLADVHVACENVAQTHTAVTMAMNGVSEQLPSLATLEEVRGQSVRGNLPQSLVAASKTLSEAAEAESAMVPVESTLR